jgi:hypothetical protein
MKAWTVVMMFSFLTSCANAAPAAWLLVNGA